MSSSLSAMNYFNWILNYELSAEQELDEAGNVIYQPPPLHMSGLMKLDVNKDANKDPDMQPISDDGSVDSSLYCQDSESEGGIWDNQDIHNVSIAPQGAQLILPDDCWR